MIQVAQTLNCTKNSNQDAGAIIFINDNNNKNYKKQKHMSSK